MLPGCTCLTQRPTRTTLPSCRRELRLLAGYGRLQGLVYRPGDPRFEGQSPETAIDNACAGTSCLFVNRNRGSGTRILIDGLLRGRRPRATRSRSARTTRSPQPYAQGRADWGLAIEPVARLYHLGFTPSRHEQYDFAIPADRWDRPAVAAFRALVNEAETRGRLAGLGFRTDREERTR